jgi:hypothetical protein
MDKDKQRIAQLEDQVRRLQEGIGRWKRKANGVAPRFTYVSERHERGSHYISIPVEGLPGDAPLHEAQEYMRREVIPRFYPYKYSGCHTSKRYSGWVVTLVKSDNTVDMSDIPAPLDSDLDYE